ncbi:hypothetical protein ACU5DF_02435 [Aliivibrio wodanis]|uniref:hypothetical protein n=1 Tax=Aliivibrio wodanis TaxID=80852 RepID=UPI00406CB326
MNIDEKIVLDLGKKLGIRIPKRKSVKYTYAAYALNDDGRVTFLSIPNVTEAVMPSELFELDQLVTLYMNEAAITSIPKEFTKLINLRYFEIFRDCVVERIDPEVFDMGLNVSITNSRNYTGIALCDAPLSEPPIEIIQNGNRAVKAYFKDKDKNATTLNEVKVLLVGEAGQPHEWLNFNL